MIKLTTPMGAGGPKLLEGAGLSVHTWFLKNTCLHGGFDNPVQIKMTLWFKLYINLHWFFHGCERELAQTLHTHFLKLSAKLLSDQEWVVSKLIYVSRNNIWNGSTIWYRNLQGCFSEMYLRIACVFLPGIGRSSTCNMELQLL